MWFQTHIWRIIESCFDKYEHLEAAIGETLSIATQRKLNKKRTISAVEPIARKNLGSKCDSIFRTYRLSYSKCFEFGASEAKAEYEISTEHLKDAFAKLPKTLTIMLDELIATKPEFARSLQTVGFVQVGLSNTMVLVDNPTGYITRVTRRKSIEINPTIENFGPTVLPSMLSAWTCAEIVKNIYQLLNSSNEEAAKKDFSWMKNYYESTEASTETLSRKKTETTGL